MFNQLRLGNLHKIGSKVGLNMGWMVMVSWLDQRRKQMQVICIKLIYPNFPGSIEGVQRKMIPFPKCDQVVPSCPVFPLAMY